MNTHTKLKLDQAKNVLDRCLSWEMRFKDEMQTLRRTAHHLSNARFAAQYSALENQLKVQERWTAHYREKIRQLLAEDSQ